MKRIICLSLLIILNGCTKPPDLNAPCREFGKFCAQKPINEIIYSTGEK